MAEKLSITIALEGGKAIEQQLEGIGKAGKKAFDEISQAAQQAGGFKNLRPEDVTAKLREMGIVGKDAFDQISGAVQSATRMERIVGAVASVEKGFSGLVSAATGFARALGPIGVVAGTVGAGIVKVMSEAAGAINKVDTAAIQAGVSIEKFSELKNSFDAAGLSAGAVAEGIQKISSVMEQANLERVNQSFKELQEASTRGFGGQGTAQMNFLLEAVQKVGPASDAARTALEKLGVVNIPEGPVTKLKAIISASDDTAVAARALIAELEKMPDTINRSAAAMAILGQKTGTEVIQALRTGSLTAEQFDQVVATLSQNQANAANKVEQSWNRVSAAWENLKTTIGGTLLVNVPDNLISTMQTIENLLNPAKWSEWGAAGRQAFIDVFAPIGELQVKLAEFVATLGGDIWSAFSSAGTAAINAISSALDKLWEKIKSVGSAIASAFGGGGGGGPAAGSIPGNASGGLIGGRGSGTSDSNLAWVSRGEHIMPARAVRQPGVLALLEALRRSGGSLRGVMDGMGRFAGGGMVPRLPAFAAGGLVGGMPHLGTVDLRTDHGSVRLMAGGSAMEQLSRLATTKRMTSTGKKPGFIG
jgi:hypothetical protein